MLRTGLQRIAPTQKNKYPPTSLPYSVSKGTTYEHSTNIAATKNVSLCMLSLATRTLAFEVVSGGGVAAGAKSTHPDC